MDKSSPTSNNCSFYSALSHSPVRSAGNAPDMSVYRPQGTPQYGIFRYKAPTEGLLQVGGPHSTETVWSDDFEIAWTKMGNKERSARSFLAWCSYQSFTVGSGTETNIAIL